MKTRIFITTSIVMLFICGRSTAQGFKLNELEYFEKPGVNVLVYSNTFSGGFNDEKNSGLEIIHHGVRTVQGGAVRLNHTPEQWDLVPSSPKRIVSQKDGNIEVTLYYPDYHFTSRLKVEAAGEDVVVSVYLDEALPETLEGHAGFNLEFLPSQYWNKTYLMDGRYHRFPRYAVSETVARPNSEKIRQFKGYKTYDDRGTEQFVDPLPMATGRRIVMAPDAPERMMTITSDADMMLFDGRMVAQNGWFVLRSLLPSGKTGKVLSWTIHPNSVKGWIRTPNVGYSQVGYLPEQPKVAVIELDKNDKPLTKASVWRIHPDGSESRCFSGKTEVWGGYYKYNYLRFDFSDVREAGIYYLQYGEVRTENFLIDTHVYDEITYATSDVWIPIHMNHMTVNEGYRIWHGEPFKEGYLQAPAPTDHFDMHWQGDSTDTPYKALELIPGLNVGGYFDAGDFDIETGANIGVVQNMVSIWERFKPLRDETFVSEEQRYVDLHRPDGTPDMLQFIRHGVLNLVAQAENIGHMALTLSNSVLDNYHHLGDAAAITDGLHYDPTLRPYEISADGKSSGTPDDMWAFTSRNTGLDARAATMFAAASRVLRGYDDGLAERALTQSKRLMEEVNALYAERQQHGRRPMTGFGGSDMATQLQLYVSTGEKSYLESFLGQIWPALERNASSAIATAMDAIPYMDEEYKEKLRPYVAKYKENLEQVSKQNPYGVPIGTGNWAGSGNVVSFGTTAAFAALYFPDIIDKTYAYNAMAFLFGCHPYHNYSLVATLGATHPKSVFYGNNRADFSFIPGNVAPGVLFRQPDHFENYDDWPFLWGQNEGTIAGNTGYLIFAHAFKNLVNENSKP